MFRLMKLTYHCQYIFTHDELHSVLSENKFVNVIFFFFFSTGLRDPIACSIVGCGIPTQNSGYKSTRLCPSKFRCLLICPSPSCSQPVVCLGDRPSVLCPAPLCSTWPTLSLRLLLSFRDPIWFPVWLLLRLRLQYCRWLCHLFPHPLQVYSGLLPPPLRHPRSWPPSGPLA